MSNQKHDAAEIVRLAKSYTSAQIAKIVGGNERYIRHVAKQGGITPKPPLREFVCISTEQLDKNVKEYVAKVRPENPVTVRYASEAELTRIFANVKPMKDETIYRWRVDTLPILTTPKVYSAKDFGLAQN